MRITPAVWSVLALLIAARPARAQCRVGSETNEAKLLAYYAVPLSFSPSGSLEATAPGSVRASIEVTFIPLPPDRLRHTSICFLPKEENSQLSSVLPRPRFAVGLPGGFFVEGTYLPPVTIASATPNMTSLAVGFVRHIGQHAGFAVRAHTTVGRVRGPITCPRKALQLNDTEKACYGDEPSNDTYHPNIVALETAVTWAGAGRAGGYVGGGVSSLRPRFQVGFQPANRDFDSTRVETDLTRVALMVGGRYRVARHILATAEIYSVPKDMTTIRLGASVSLR